MSQAYMDIARRAWELDGEALAEFDSDAVYNPLEEEPSYGVEAMVPSYERWATAVCRNRSRRRLASCSSSRLRECSSIQRRVDNGPVALPLRASMRASQTLSTRASGVVGALALGREIAIEHPRGFAFGAREQVPIAVERDRDIRVAHVGRERLRVDPGGDHQRGKGVATFVRGDPSEPGFGPSLIGSGLQRLGRERGSPRCARRKRLAFAGLAQPVGDQVLVPTKEQAAQLVEHFGEPRTAAQAVDVSQTTVYRWLLPPERQAKLREANRERMRERRTDPNYRNPSRAYMRAYQRKR